MPVFGDCSHVVLPSVFRKMALCGIATMLPSRVPATGATLILRGLKVVKEFRKSSKMIPNWDQIGRWRRPTPSVHFELFLNSFTTFSPRRIREIGRAHV